MFKKLKKDSVPLGIIIGLLIPAILFSILFFVNNNYFPKAPMLRFERRNQL